MIQIDFRDSRPIYEQIKDGMLRLIMTQALKPNDRIP
ncbi:MAG TPA: GntR family transcriptional regulator, partial [Lachnospiraceae bacterium]|nr:GntR family transcriptional regulator [Lachnospiraceae bacterium]